MHGTTSGTSFNNRHATSGSARTSNAFSILNGRPLCSIEERLEVIDVRERPRV
jgi:hypothetical protein